MEDHEGKSGVRYELMEIGRYLIKIAEEDDRARRKPEEREDSRTIAAPVAPLGEDAEGLIRVARSEYRERMLRAKFVQNDLLGEPAWDILLDLFISKAGGTRISISSACIASQVPYTTALRWLKLLERNGLIIRSDDHDDGRRSWIELTDEGYQRMASYLRCCRQNAL